MRRSLRFFLILVLLVSAVAMAPRFYTTGCGGPVLPGAYDCES
ncbi:MAG TPA: hypothetical protein VD969_05875 [Symbiobacteriaceae bacterium]|nr:hypothetical protein [Symbiobacteriaceae bacterium]